MPSGAPGANSSTAEVLGLSKHGFWLLLREGEVFVPFEKFPWFKTAPVSGVLNVRRLSADHLRWPDLDVDLHVGSLRDPNSYPLIARTPVTRLAEPARAKYRAPRRKPAAKRKTG